MRRLASLRLPGAIVLASLIGAQGCGSSSSTGTTTSSITFGISPTSATVQVGGSTTVSGTIVRTNFTGDITLTATNLPSGVTATLISAPTNGGTTGSVSLTATSAATPGTYPITVTASGSGITSVSQNFSLTIAAASSSSYVESLSASALSVAQGATGNTTVTYTRTNFTGNITPSVDNLPSGVTAAFSVNPVTGTTSTLTLTVGSAVTAGQYTMAVRGVASGLTDVTTPLTLTVTAVAGSYTIALSSSAQSIAQSGNANNTVTITRTNFTGNVTLSVANLPSGVTASFSPNPATGNTSTLTLTVGATVAAAVYNVNVVGTASGLANVTTPLTLTVTSSGGGGIGSVTVDYSTCTGANIPIWVAYQDGTGAWTHVTGTNNTYHFTVSSSKGGFAAVTLSGALYTTAVTYLTQTDLAGTTLSQCASATGKTINGTVAGLNSADQANIRLGGGATTVSFGGSSAFQLTNVASGNQTLVAYRRNVVTPGTTDKAVLRPNQNIAAGGSLALIDFGSAEAFSPSSATFTVSGGTAGDNVSTVMTYLTTTACVSNLLYSAFGTYAASSTQYGMPSGQQASTDFHQFTVQDINAGSTVVRSISTTFHTFAAQSIALPANLPAGTITTLSGGIGTRRQIALTLPSDYSSFGFSYSDAAGNTFSATATGSYLGGQSVVLGMPDFSAAGAYLAIYGPGSGTLSTSLFAIGSSGAACTEGATSKTASVSGTTN